MDTLDSGTIRHGYYMLWIMGLPLEMFFDSAKKNEEKQTMAFGWVGGVTTNPSLLAKEGRPPQ